MEPTSSSSKSTSWKGVLRRAIQKNSVIKLIQLQQENKDEVDQDLQGIQEKTKNFREKFQTFLIAPDSDEASESSKDTRAPWAVWENKANDRRSSIPAFVYKEGISAQMILSDDDSTTPTKAPVVVKDCSSLQRTTHVPAKIREWPIMHESSEAGVRIIPEPEIDGTPSRSSMNRSSSLVHFQDQDYSDVTSLLSQIDTQVEEEERSMSPAMLMAMSLINPPKSRAQCLAEEMNKN